MFSKLSQNNREYERSLTKVTLNPENFINEPSDLISLLNLILKTSKGSMKVDTMVLAIITLKKVEVNTL